MVYLKRDEYNIRNLVNPPPIKQRKAKEKTFTKLRTNILHHTPLCLEDECQENAVYADFLHIFQHPGAQEKLKELEEKIQTLIPRGKRQELGNFQPYWISPDDGNLPNGTYLNTPVPILGQEELIPATKLKLATIEHMTERKLSEMRWNTLNKKTDLKRKESPQMNLRVRGTMGYFPKSAMEYVKKVKKNKEEAVSLATSILTAQLETFVEIRKLFWKNRFEKIKSSVKIHKLRFYQKPPGT